MFSTPETSVHVRDENREISPLISPQITWLEKRQNLTKSYRAWGRLFDWLPRLIPALYLLVLHF